MGGSNLDHGEKSKTKEISCEERSRGRNPCLHRRTSTRQMPDHRVFQFHDRVHLIKRSTHPIHKPAMASLQLSIGPFSIHVIQFTHPRRSNLLGLPFLIGLPTHPVHPLLLHSMRSINGANYPSLISVLQHSARRSLTSIHRDGTVSLSALFPPSYHLTMLYTRIILSFPQLSLTMR